MIIIQNLFISLGVIALILITSLTGIVSSGIAIFFHEGSMARVAAICSDYLDSRGKKDRQHESH